MRAELTEKTIRGLNTAWLAAGPETAPLILFLHGFPDVADSWDRQIEHFSTRFRVIAPYIRGAAPSASAKDVSRYSPDAIALDLLSILSHEKQNNRSLYIVGHDLGSVHAWALAALMPGRVSGLVIINGLTIAQMLKRFKSPRQLAKSWYMFLAQIPALPEFFLERFPGRFLSLAHRIGKLKKDARPETHTITGALAGPLNQYRAFARAIPAVWATKQRRRVGCPVLVLWGSEDAFLVPPTLDEMETEADQVTVRILRGNHWLHREQADKVNGLLDEFFTNKLATL